MTLLAPNFRIARTCLALVCLALLLTACVSQSDGPTANIDTIDTELGDEPTVGNSAPTDDGSPSSATYTDPDGGDAGHGDPKRTTWKPLGNKTDRQGFDRRYVLARPGLSDEELIEEAKSMRGQYPKGWFWILDDESGWPAMWAHLENWSHPEYPIDWIETHTQGYVELEFEANGDVNWVLYRGFDSKKIANIAEATCGETYTSCT